MANGKSPIKRSLNFTLKFLIFKKGNGIEIFFFFIVKYLCKRPKY